MIKRGDFTKGSLAAGALMMLPSCKTVGAKGANERLNVEIIGVGGRGEAAVAPFTEMCLFSVISSNFQGEKLHYNRDKMEFANCKEANAHLRSLYAYNKECLP